MLPTTAPLFSCPQCHTAVRAGDRTCGRCGVNLALAAVLAEHHTLARIPNAGPPPLANLPRFGEFLIREGYLSPLQLKTALARQREAAAQGVQRTIGQTLLEMGLVTREQLELASVRQVRQLQAALEENNRQLEQRVRERTQALEDALRKLAELGEVKANLVANISHELRTPLVPIRGYGDLLRSGMLGPLTDKQRTAVEAIDRGAQRLGELIDELIQFASSVKGKLVINPTVVSLADLIDPLWDYFGPRSQSAQIGLRHELPPDLPLISADAEKLYWVLFQLVDNALKFTPAGGQVALRAEAHRAHDGSPARVRISVQDTGQGISPEKLGEIFQPFHQVLGEPAQLVEGTGLGLALVKRIVEAHDSRVEVESRPRLGSTFTFELPVAGRPQ